MLTLPGCDIPPPRQDPKAFITSKSRFYNYQVSAQLALGHTLEGQDEILLMLEAQFSLRNVDTDYIVDLLEEYGIPLRLDEGHPVS